MSPHPDSAPAAPQGRRRPWPRPRATAAGGALLCLLAATACILALTWPWCLRFEGFFLDHWDPPFHAWKLEVMARKILDGDFGFRNRETTLFYPYSGTLYYEALTWPAALAAALLTEITRAAPEWIYHVVLIAFWSLSAPCMRQLLLSLGVGRAAAFAGGLLFCILPYRLSYANEFQMQMAFPAPLIYLLLRRLLAGGRIRDGIGLALMWWLLAVTEQRAVDRDPQGRSQGGGLGQRAVPAMEREPTQALRTGGDQRMLVGDREHDEPESLRVSCFGK